MTQFDLLSTVQPSTGWFAIVGIKGKKGVKQELVATREEADAVVQKFLEEKRNVFFGVAKYKEGSGRKKDNVQALKSFWLDIDCGEAKAVPNKHTGRPEGYVDQAAGLKALKAFCTLIGLPKPTIVNSGRGIHAYWALENSISKEEWEPVAERLKQLCTTHDFYIDNAVFEVARILRVPGTLNFKDTPPKPVSVLAVAPLVSFQEFRELLGVYETQDTASTPAPKKELTALGKAFSESNKDISSNFAKIMRRSAKEDGCNQLLSCYLDRATLAEPRWFDALSIAKFCTDKDTAIHKISAGHEAYDAASTESKIQHIQGPHTCAVFEDHNPGGCGKCPLQGKIRSPIVLGRELPPANDASVVEVETEGEVEEHVIPKIDKPFFRADNGCIWREPYEEEGDPLFVYEHTIYVVKRMFDPVLKNVVVMKIHMPKDGVTEFVVPVAVMAQKAELKKELAAYNVLCSDKRFNMLVEYLQGAVRNLQHSKKAEQMRTQFGWADKQSKFIIGDREITKDGIFHSPPSSITETTAEKMTPAGTIEKWQEVFDLYGRPGLEPHAFTALTAFGAPLFGFLGQSGAIINLYNSTSGAGKTTILEMINSVYGHPEHLCLTQEDTYNSKIQLLGVFNNLPITIDEITNMEPKPFSNLTYAISQGRGKERMLGSANQLRRNTTSWNTVAVCSSNASFYEKLTSLKTNPDGEMMRLMEYQIDFTGSIDPTFGKKMFEGQLRKNYGHAGPIYAEYLVNNLEAVKATLYNTQAKIDRDFKLTQRERFWSAIVAANMTGALYAQHLGLITWDLKAIYKWAYGLVREIRKDVAPPSNNVVAAIGDYMYRHMQNILVIQDEVDSRTQMQALPVVEPRGDLLIRSETDTKQLFIATGAFKADCVKYQVNYKGVLKQLKEKGILLSIDNKRLAKGTKIEAPSTRTMVLDSAHPEFAGISTAVESKLGEEDEATS